MAEIHQFPPRDPPDPEAPEIPRFSEDALALKLAHVHDMQLAYLAAWSRWLHWDGAHWLIDTTLSIYDLARKLIHAELVQAEEEKVNKIPKHLHEGRTVAAIVNLARSDRRLAATVDQWDTDPWLFNTPTGTVDLRTGYMREHRREDYITKIAAVGPRGECPMWFDFLDRVTAGDLDLQRYLKRVAGYCLTGSIREHALFFIFGTGGNGKGVFLNTIIGIMGSYAQTAPIELFMASSGDQHPTGLAGLRGARMVTAVETEEGRRWAESKIKGLTGGDKIAARFMRQDFFEFTPQFKLVIAGNHKPGLRGVDEAMRRRMNLIPFDVTIPDEQKDKDLAEKLKPEWPGILRWMVEGCLEWQEEQLNPPAAVVGATEHYLEAEDSITQWMTECCELGASLEELSTPLFRSWKLWAEGAGEHPGSQKRFSQTIESRGMTPKRQPNTGKSMFIGLKLKLSPKKEEPDIPYS